MLKKNIIKNHSIFIYIDINFIKRCLNFNVCIVFWDIIALFLISFQFFLKNFCLIYPIFTLSSAKVHIYIIIYYDFKRD